MVYAAIINTIVTVAMWTVGFVVMGKEGERISIRKVALNPGAVGVYIGLPLLLFSLELPDPFQSVVGFLADMNTPLAMICIGVFISKTKLLDIFKEKTLYWVTVIRLLLIPAAVMGDFASVSTGLYSYDVLYHSVLRSQRGADGDSPPVPP